MYRKSVLRINAIFIGSKKLMHNARSGVIGTSRSIPLRESLLYQENANDGAHYSSGASVAAKVAMMKNNEFKSDAVQNAIRILNNNNVTNSPKFVMSERLDDFEKLIIEAKQSINDCFEGDKELLEDDRQTANDAVREAMDFFDDIRYDFSQTINEEGSFSNDESNNVIEIFAKQLEQLKEELDTVLGQTEKGNMLVGLENITNTITNWKR